MYETKIDSISLDSIDVHVIGDTGNGCGCD